MELCYTNYPNNLFKKYAGLVTSLTKHQLFRDYLSTKSGLLIKEPVNLLLPNGYHIVREKHKDKLIVEATFSSGAPYADKLWRKLEYLDAASMFLNDFSEAQRLLLAYLGLRFDPLLLKLPAFTTSTFFPDGTNPGTTSCSGDVSRQTAGESFSTTRTSAGTNSRTNNDLINACLLEATASSNQYDIQFRGIFTFDTSSIGSGQTVSAATLSLMGRNTGTAGLGGSFIEIAKPAPASAIQLANSDYNIASWTMTAQGTHVAQSSWLNGSYNDFPLNATGISNVVVAGISKYGAVSDLDLNNTTPTWSSTATFAAGAYDAGHAGTSNDPKLVATYAATPVASSGSSFLLNFI